MTQLQGGEFQVIIDGDLFKAVVSFPVKRAEYKSEKPSVDTEDMSQEFDFEEEV